MRKPYKKHLKIRFSAARMFNVEFWVVMINNHCDFFWHPDITIKTSCLIVTEPELLRLGSTTILPFQRPTSHLPNTEPPSQMDDPNPSTPPCAKDVAKRPSSAQSRTTQPLYCKFWESWACQTSRKHPAGNPCFLQWHEVVADSAI